MEIQQRIEKIFAPLSPLTFEIKKFGKKSGLFLVLPGSKFNARVDNAYDVLHSFVDEVWQEFTSYTNSLLDTKKQKSYALLEGKKNVQSILLNIKHSKAILKYPAEAVEYFEYCKAEDPYQEYEQISIIDFWEGMLRTELPFYLDNWVVFIDHYYQKSQLKIKDKVLFATETPFAVTDRKHARKRLERLFNTLVQRNQIEAEIRSFQNVFLGGPVTTKIKWKISIYYLPGFIKALLDSELVVKRMASNVGYWHYLSERIIDKKGNPLLPNIKNTSTNYGTDKAQEKYIFEPLKVLMEK